MNKTPPNTHSYGPPCAAVRARVYTPSVDYARNDLFERMERARQEMIESGFHENMRKARENPMFVERRIDEGMEEFNRLSRLALLHNVSTDAMKSAESALRFMQGSWRFFHFLGQRCEILPVEEAVNERALEISSDDDDKRALSLLLTRDEITPKRIASLVRRYENRAKRAKVLPVRLRYLAERLETLERNLTLG